MLHILIEAQISNFFQKSLPDKITIFLRGSIGMLFDSGFPPPPLSFAFHQSCSFCVQVIPQFHPVLGIRRDTWFQPPSPPTWAHNSLLPGPFLTSILDPMSFTSAEIFGKHEQNHVTSWLKSFLYLPTVPIRKFMLVSLADKLAHSGPCPPPTPLTLGHLASFNTVFLLSLKHARVILCRGFTPAVPSPWDGPALVFVCWVLVLSSVLGVLVLFWENPTLMPLSITYPYCNFRHTTSISNILVCLFTCVFSLSLPLEHKLCEYGNILLDFIFCQDFVNVS